MSLAGLNRVRTLFENRNSMDPWRYLEILVSSDRGPEHDEHWMTRKLQESYPGPYKVEKVIDYQWQSVEYKIVFDSPQDETWYRLQYPYDNSRN